MLRLPIRRSDMEIHAQVSMDRPLLSKIVRAAYRPTFLRLRIGGAVLVPVGLLGVAFGNDPRWPSALLMLAGLLTLVTPELMLVMAYRRLARVADLPWSYTITPEEITESTPMFRSTRPWSGVREATETPDLWILRTQLGGIIGLPKQAFTPEQASQVRAILAQSGLLQ
jgi:hypothetical protein